jgi:xanthine dehydrogenase accessory factor
MIRGELAELAEEELIAGGVPFVEATVVRAQSPTSVRAGDAAIVRRDGSIEGFVGGACAETSVRLHALRVLETGEPLLLRILPGEAEGEAAAGDGAVTVKNPCLSGGALEIFLEPHLPAATIRVVGQSPIALALADLGKRLGYAVELSAAEDSDPRADDAAVVVASHGHEEERVLTAALREGVPYVGLVASKVRGDAVRGSLDLPDELRAQLRTPAGLEIGAQTPEEIALAILAEIVALRRSGEGGANGQPIAAAEAGRGDDRPVETPPSIAAPAPTSTEVALDPVCGMEVAVSEASIQLELNGERYYFCSEGCRDSFAAQGAPDAGVR